MLADPSMYLLGLIAGCLDEDGFIEADSDMAQRYLVEPLGLYQGTPAAIIRPTSAEQISAVIRICNHHHIGVVPYGGGTGVVGGQVCIESPPSVVLSLERMNSIRAVLDNDWAVVAEAGVILADLKEAVDAADRMFPLSLAAEGSCQIGGNLATNAGGVQVLRYGNIRDLTLGIEAVMADGSVYSDLEPLRKNNTGYDLRHLLIGSEGTLGVITAATLKVFPKPVETVTGMLAISLPEDAVNVLGYIRERLGYVVSAFELIAGSGVKFIDDFYPDSPDPLDNHPAWRVLIEFSSSSKSNLVVRSSTVFEELLLSGQITGGSIARNESQRRHMWWMRETIPECNARVGGIASFDISVPISKVASFIMDAQSAINDIDPDLRINCYGHVGDGNLHYNVFTPDCVAAFEYDHCADLIKTAIYDLVQVRGGSFSAEHGIGRLKTSDLVKYGNPAKLSIIRTIKDALDPNGILNPSVLMAALSDEMSF